MGTFAHSSRKSFKTFGLLATFGLLPVGLNTSHQAMEASIGSQIVQHVVNDARQTDFAVLTSGSANIPRYFDYQGNELGSSSMNYLYEVNTSVAPQTSLPNSAAIPTLATVTVQIATNSAHLAWGSPSLNVSTYTALVAKNK